MNKTIKNRYSPDLKPDLKINFIKFFILLLIIAFVSGCGGIGHNVNLKFKPGLNVNNSKPFYVVIRKVTKTNFLIDDYNKIAEMVYSDPPDESLLGWHVMLPGQKKDINVKKPDNSSIGIYGLFTNPGKNWKIMIDSPLGSKYKIDLLDNNLKFNKYGFWQSKFKKSKNLFGGSGKNN